MNVPSDAQFPNLTIVRQILEDMGGNEVVEFCNGAGASMLRWAHRNGTKYNVHIAIPRQWLVETDRAGKLTDAARHFASNVRFASSR
ncbi:MAG: hypothetical protein ABJF10_23230 [Chthoniobacter sp.]|uniref:hypothetical protein n=1 Tax=Chthoniobacter sp. TaxID=2510640 RepID=UPI0032A9EE19